MQDPTAASSPPEPLPLPPITPAPAMPYWSPANARLGVFGPQEAAWVTIGEFSSSQFHAARALLTRHEILSRAAPAAAGSSELLLQVPPTEVTWALEVLAGRGGPPPREANAIPVGSSGFAVAPADSPPAAPPGLDYVRPVLQVNLSPVRRSTFKLDIAIWSLWILLALVLLWLIYAIYNYNS